MLGKIASWIESALLKYYPKRTNVWYFSTISLFFYSTTRRKHRYFVIAAKLAMIDIPKLAGQGFNSLFLHTTTGMLSLKRIHFFITRSYALGFSAISMTQTISYNGKYWEANYLLLAI